MLSEGRVFGPRPKTAAETPALPENPPFREGVILNRSNQRERPDSESGLFKKSATCRADSSGQSLWWRRKRQSATLIERRYRIRPAKPRQTASNRVKPGQRFC